MLIYRLIQNLFFLVALVSLRVRDLKERLREYGNDLGYEYARKQKICKENLK